MIPFFEALFDRFHELHTEIEQALDALPRESLDWKPGPEMNSLSVLVVHLTGGERFWIGDIVMDDSSNRNRGEEFHVAGLDTSVLKHHLKKTGTYIKAAFETLILQDLETSRLTPPYGKKSHRSLGVAACPGTYFVTPGAHPAHRPALAPAVRRGRLKWW